MTSPALIRPQKVTFACLFVGFSSLIALTSIGSTLADWGSIEFREQIVRLIAQEPFSEAGFQINDVLGWLRWALMAGAAVATSGIIFAIWTAKGHQPSRIILTIMCAFASVLFLAGGLWGLLPAALAIGCGFYLWAPESRRWFAVKNGKTVPAQKATTPPSTTPEFAPSSVSPPPYPSESTAPPMHNTASGSDSAPQRPKAALIASLITLAAAVPVALICAINAIAYLAAPDTYVNLINDQPLLRESGVLGDLGMTAASFARVIFAACLVGALLALAAIATAATLLRRSSGGRLTMLTLAGLTLAISIVGFPVGLPWTAAAIAVIVCLQRRDVKAWFGHVSRATDGLQK